MSIGQCELEILVELRELSLNSSGTFSVVLSLQSSDSEKLTKDVFFEVDNHGKEQGHSTNIGSVEVPQVLVGKAVKFQKKVKFYISKGIFKDDDESSLILLVDVFKKNDVNVKECSSRVVIFQSPGSLPEPGPDMTVTSVKKNILNLTSKLPDEGITIHIGRVICSYSLKANKVKQTPEPSPEPSPEPTLPPPPPLLPTAEVEDKPKEDVKKTLPKKKGSERYRRHIVSQLGREEVIVHVHAASGLPNLLQDSSPPFPYVSGTTKSDEDAGVSPQQTTSIAKTPTFFPSWEETIVIEIDEVDSDTEVVLLVNDLTSQSTLIRYQIPVVYLKPFHQYHLDLIQEGVGFETHLYASILHRTCRLQLLDALTYSGVEITLCSLARKISNVSDPLMAVIRIVPDYYVLRKEIETRKYINELHPRPVHCPVRELDFTAANLKHSNPQISLPLAQTGSSWEQQLLFCEPRLMASTFTATSALIVEYYSTITAFESSKWYLDKSLGYSTMLLNKHVYNALKSERGRKGIRVENLSLKGTSLHTENDHIPAINLVLRLISEEHPSSLLNASYVDDLPKLEHFSMEAERLPPPPSPSPTPLPSPTPSPPPKKESSPRIPLPTKTPVQKKIPFRDGETPPPIPLYHNPVVHSPKPRAYKLVLKEDELPPLDAVQNLLPDSHRVILDPDQRYQDHPGLIPTRLPPKDLNDDPPREPKSKSRQTPPDRYAITLLDHQQRELDNYKTAMKRMGDEIVKLQEEITRLEVVNSKLRQQINMHEDTTRALLRDSELTDIPRNELVQRYASLRDKLSSQVREATSYRDKLLQLQNELIRHNDREKEFINLQEAHFKQSAILQRFQEKQQKIKKLEETCRKQEEVIEKMEKLLKGKIRKGKDEATPKLDAKEAFLAENSRLRSEINQMKNKSQIKEVSFDDAERMELYSKLDRSDGRIRTLERAVRENARKWGQEKEELLLRLNEQNHRASLPPVNRSYYRYDDEDDFEDRVFPKHRTRLRPRGRYGSPHLEPLM
ncbi:coiled-coil domain-containing protein 33-like isoform X2 [Anneissia japonica]|uniref:coiled-coil domain-containing protein 33-like isoform X2 n=1 Tax=Anneissia japonica TaxID=1529436 RepID=UPI0014255C51|nr:coiled-coil domain-containing protein 33-like isoform X2 [Anneissia japonica]